MVLASHGENFGLSIAEALMAKKPVLVTKVGAVTEFLNKHNFLELLEVFLQEAHICNLRLKS